MAEVVGTMAAVGTTVKMVNQLTKKKGLLTRLSRCCFGSCCCSKRKKRQGKNKRGIEEPDGDNNYVNKTNTLKFVCCSTSYAEPGTSLSFDYHNTYRQSKNSREETVSTWV